MDTLSTIWQGLDWSRLTDILLSVIPALVCITLHELSHGYVAYRLGDMTAKRAGRLTLNPLKHLDIVGLLMMAVFHFGWAKPVPVDMRNFKNPKRGMALTALAGPVSNVLITAAALFIYGLLYFPLCDGGSTAQALLTTVGNIGYLSAAYAVFNILPIPPLDGSKVFLSVLSDEAYARLMRYERFGMLLLILLAVTNALDATLGAAAQWLFDRLFFFARWGWDISRMLFT